VNELVVLGVVQMGKTFALAVWLYLGAWVKPLSLNWWTAPTYSQAEVGFKEIRSHLEPAGALARVVESRLRLELVNGSTIECRSWERDENLLGPSIDGRIVVDQAELLTGRARSIISTRRAASLAPIWYAGNAGVHGCEFYRLCRQAEAAQRAASKDMGFMRWTWKDRYEALKSADPIEAARYAAFIDLEKLNQPSEEFARMYESEWLTTGAGVLSLLPACRNGGDELHPVPIPYFEAWEPEEPVVAGLDLAMERNWTVLTVVGMQTGRLKAIDRFHRVAWEAQMDRVVKTLNRYSRTRKAALDSQGKLKASSVPLYMDATGIGGPVLEVLLKATAGSAIDCIPITFDNAKKQAMVAAIQVGVQQETFSMPYIQEAVEEAANLERTGLTSSVRYKAPDGMDDDIVWSLGLALYGKTRSITGEIL
jgi:hypothetical protein